MPDTEGVSAIVALIASGVILAPRVGGSGGGIGYNVPRSGSFSADLMVKTVQRTVQTTGQGDVRDITGDAQ